MTIDTTPLHEGQPVMRCDNCWYWRVHYEYRPGSECAQAVHADDHSGTCHRYPPQIDSVYAGRMWKQGGEGAESLSIAWLHPVTKGDNWCGDFDGYLAVDYLPGKHEWDTGDENDEETR